ncbi:MAG: hypothetical protein ACR2MT_03975 [Aurantibacter sp.]
MGKQLFLICVFLFSTWIGFSQDNCPCCTENHQAFDFWEGEWKVTNPDGTAAGRNVIVKLEDNCVLRESWKSANGNSTGTSTNFYNSTTGQWEQLWVDNSGSHLKLKGNRTNNQMILASDEFVGADGKKGIHRITWTSNEDGTVRQLWEVLQEGKVVRVAFDGLYTKIE